MIAHLKPVLQMPLPRPNGSIGAQSFKESTVCARMWNNAMEKYKHKNSMSKKEKKGKAHSNTNRTTTGSPQHGTAWRNKFNRGIIERNPPNSDLPVAAAAWKGDPNVIRVGDAIWVRTKKQDGRTDGRKVRRAMGHA